MLKVVKHCLTLVVGRITFSIVITIFLSVDCLFLSANYLFLSVDYNKLNCNQRNTAVYQWFYFWFHGTGAECEKTTEFRERKREKRWKPNIFFNKEALRNGLQLRMFTGIKYQYYIMSHMTIILTWQKKKNRTKDIKISI